MPPAQLLAGLLEAHIPRALLLHGSDAALQVGQLLPRLALLLGSACAGREDGGLAAS